MLVLHPFLIAAIPILHILAANPEQVRFMDTLIPLSISLGFAAVAFILLRKALKSAEAAGLIVSLFLVLFFSYGHLAEVLPGGWALHLLFAVFCLIFAGGTYWVARSKEGLRNPTRIVNVVAATLLLLVVVNMLVGGFRGESTIRADEVRKAAESGKPLQSDLEDPPDIYYIILDGYGSERYLVEEYGFDNSEFIQRLEDRGFYVVPGAKSNYNWTHPSLSSSLNMNYIDRLTEESSDSTSTMQMLIEDNSLMRFLKSRGYAFAFFGTGWSVTRSNRYADISYGPPWKEYEFTRVLINSTAIRYFATEKEHTVSRETILEAFSRIPQVRREVSGPLFLFAHIVSPHEPFLFDRDGNPLENEDDVRDYLEQLMFVNTRVEELVDRVIQVSERPPVIVIQGDHGPEYGTGIRTTDILNAYYVPDGDDLLYESITPVNSFRVILNTLFDTGFELLEDRG
jgi:hypothetical protein